MHGSSPRAYFCDPPWDERVPKRAAQDTGDPTGTGTGGVAEDPAKPAHPRARAAAVRGRASGAATSSPGPAAPWSRAPAPSGRWSRRARSPSARPSPIILTSGDGFGDEAQEHHRHDQRRRGDHPAGGGQCRGPPPRRCRRWRRTPRGCARAGTPRSPWTGRTAPRRRCVGIGEAIRYGLVQAEQVRRASPTGTRRPRRRRPRRSTAGSSPPPSAAPTTDRNTTISSRNDAARIAPMNSGRVSASCPVRSSVMAVRPGDERRRRGRGRGRAPGSPTSRRRPAPVVGIAGSTTRVPGRRVARGSPTSAMPGSAAIRSASAGMACGVHAACRAGRRRPAAGR